MRREIGLENAHDIEWLGIGLVTRLKLKEATFDFLLNAPLAQIALRDGARIELIAIDASGSSSSIRSRVGQIPCTVRAQFANQVQLAAKCHFERGCVAKVTVQHQIGQWQQAADTLKQC